MKDTVSPQASNASSPKAPLATTMSLFPSSASQQDYTQQYSRRLLQNLNLLRQSSESASLCDVEIIPGWTAENGSSFSSRRQLSSIGSDAEGNTVCVKPLYAHRTILAAASPYFNAMFTGGLAEARRQQIVLQSMSDVTLESLLDFMYSGEIKVNRENVQDLIIAGDMIELHEVVEICTNYLMRELEPSNAFGFFRFADDHNCMALRSAARTFICDHFNEVTKEDEFAAVPRDMIVDFLSSEYLRVDSEHQVFVAAMNWIEGDLSARRRFVFDVLKFIRLPLVPSKLLESYLDECGDISLKVALTSIKKDIAQRKGSLATLSAEPRLHAKKNIYVIGGSQRELGSAWTRSECTYQTVEVFDTFKGKWGQVSPMHIGRILPGIAVMHGCIYVCGGEVESQILANGEVYDPNEDSWTEMASMIVPRCEFGMCAMNGYLYAFGGWVGEDIGGSIERYDPSTDQWKLIAKMAEPRFSMGIFAYQGLIYLVGGCTHSRRHMQELVSYNPITGEWSTYNSMLVPRSQMGCVVLDEYLYVVGGTNRHNEVLQSVERYSFKDNHWEIIASMKEPRASPSVAAANGKIYVFGGDQIIEVNFYRARTTIAATECYDPLINTWTSSVELPQTRSESGAVVI